MITDQKYTPRRRHNRRWHKVCAREAFDRECRSLHLTLEREVSEELALISEWERGPLVAACFDPEIHATVVAIRRAV